MMCSEYENVKNSSKIGKLLTKISFFTRVLELKYSDSYSIFRFWQYSVLVLVLDFEKLKITRYSLGTRFLRFSKVLELLKSTRFEYFVLACPFPAPRHFGQCFWRLGQWAYDFGQHLGTLVSVLRELGNGFFQFLAIF